MGIAIRVNNEYLDLPGNLQIRLNLNNTIFEDDIVQGSFSYKFRFDASDKNKLILKYPEIPSYVGNDSIKYEADIYIDGILSFEGTLRLIRPSNSQFYSADLVLDVGTFARNYESKTLKDILTGSEVLPEIATNYKYHKVLSLPESPLVQIELLRNAVQVATEGTPPSVADGLLELASDYNGAQIDYFAYAINNDFWIFPVADNDAALFEIRYNASDLTKYALSLETENKIDFPNTNSDHFEFPTLRYVNEFYQDKNPDFFGDMNAYTGGVYLYNTLKNRLNNYAFSPQFKLFFLLDELFAESNYTWNGDFKLDSELADLLVFNTYAIDEQLPDLTGLVFNAHDRDVLYENHVPDISFSELLHALQKVFCLGYIIDNGSKNVSFNLRKNIFTADYVDWTDKIVRRVENNQMEEATNHTLKWIDDDIPVAGNGNDPFFGEYTADAGKEKTSIIETAGVGLRYENDLTPPATIPEESPGNSIMFDLGVQNDFVLRLQFWRGIVQDSPIMQSGIPPAAVANYTLEWDDLTNGLYTQFWTEWLDFLQNTKVFKEQVILTGNDIRRFGELQTMRVRIDNQFYLVRNIDATARNTFEAFSTPARVELWLIP